ncbi:Meiotic Sister-Chromatid recombination aldehyde dehydrogenase, partial [Ascosphaera atra]
MSILDLFYIDNQAPLARQCLAWGFKVVFTVLAFYCTHRVYVNRYEAAVDFEIPVIPELKEDWSGKRWEDLSEEDQKILEGQARGAFDESKILSYCPADGRVLGDAATGIKPATPEDIEIAVQRAEKAHQQWKETTFSDRRKVLRTLLKY